MFKRVLSIWQQVISNLSPQMLLIYSFMVLILAGTVLLSLPFSQTKDVGIVDTFFIATSAACVTGLSPVDIVSSFSFFGEFVILLLIQFGGVGLMTFAAIGFRIIGARLSMTTQEVLEDTFYQNYAAKEFRHTFNVILYLILTIEFIGAGVMFCELITIQPFLQALWTAVFHSISAFCNAGFSRYHDSLTGASVFNQSVIMVLIILGGLGHVVLVELFNFIKSRLRNKSRDSARWFSYHVRVVLVLSFGLIILGTVVVYCFNYDLEGMSLFAALFQSVTSRTAGFNSIDQSSLHTPSIMIIMLLMLVGGSPCSCAGGVKTTTLAVWLAHIKAMVLGKYEIIFMGMKVPNIIVVKASKLVGLAIIWNIIGMVILSSFEEEFSLSRLLFEQISAFATVGLSMDVTPLLGDVSKIWLVITMFVGRLGPLTIALTIPRNDSLRVNHPEGRIMVG